MPEALKCPDCSAPLDAPPNAARSMRCPYCHSTVLLDRTAPREEVAEDLGAVIGKALEMAQITGHLSAGRKIEAIKVYRQTYGVDLRTAKTAVEQMAAGGRPVGAEGAAAEAIPRGLKVGCLLAIVIAVAVGFFVSRILHTVRERVSAISPPTATKTPRVSPIAPPVSPAFATMALEFGSEGTGPGQFEDQRSVAVDGAGHIYVGEYQSGRVQVFNADGSFVKAWSVGGKAVLLNLAANRAGTVFAVVPGGIRCYEGSTGRLFGEAATTHDDARENYSDVCVAQSGDLYAISQYHNIVILNGDGQIQKVINAAEKTGEDSLALDKITVNGTNEIYALDRSKGVFKFAPDGRYLNRFGSGKGKGPDTIHNAFNLAVDGQGRVYVSSFGPAIRVFDGDGHYQDSFGGDDVAFGLAIDDKNEVFACYRNKHTVRKYALAKR